MMKARDFFTEQQQKEIVAAIQEAERNTSGEIRLHVDYSGHKDVPKRVLQVFEELEMHQTTLKNGVLFYIAIKSHDFVIIGDKGIYDLVPENFWDEIKNTTITHFQQGDFVTGLVDGIKLCGSKLKEHFPYQTDDVNELSDEISFGA